MIELLNANKILKILDFFTENKHQIYYPEKLEFVFNNDLSTIRNLIFNDYLLPVAKTDNKGEILELSLFDLRNFNESQKYLILQAGNIDKSFILQAIKPIQELFNDLKIQKIIIKDLSSEFKVIDKAIIDSGYKMDFSVDLKKGIFIQYGLYL